MIVLSDQDDVWRADKLQLLEQELIDHPSAGLVFSDAELVDRNLKSLGRRMWHQVGFDAHKQKLIRTGKSLDVLITGWTVTGATMAFRSDYVKLALPIPSNIAMIPAARTATGGRTEPQSTAATTWWSSGLRNRAATA
jgi:hypothetical protein